jgi:DNA-binding response OmpR family regulator
MAQQTILVVDDSASERAVVEKRLTAAGYAVVTATDGREGLRRLYETHPDLVLLDIVMPELDGWKTLEMIRQVSEVPVIMVTGLDAEVERIRGLRAGADDYVGKPFSAGELVARVQAVLRRSAGQGDVREVYDDGVVGIDYGAGEVRVHGEVVALTPLEFRLLAAFVQHPGQVLSRGQLMELVWGDTYGAGDQVKIYVGFLRRKLGVPELIETARGFGYRYRRPNTTSTS